MNGSHFTLAAAALPVLPPGSSLESHALEILAVIGGAVLVFLAGIVWAVYFRKTHHHHHHHHRQPETVEAETAPVEPPLASEFEPRRHRHRRRRREHRRRNPTLAETGGLPPARHQPPEPSP